MIHALVRHAFFFRADVFLLPNFLSASDRPALLPSLAEREDLLRPRSTDEGHECRSGQEREELLCGWRLCS